MTQATHTPTARRARDGVSSSAPAAPSSAVKGASRGSFLWHEGTLYFVRDGEERKCVAIDFSDDDRVTITVFNARGSEVFEVETPAALRLAEALADCLPPE
jgi:hypothetical protein